MTSGEGFGGLPVLPGRPGIAGMPLPRGFGAKAADSKSDAEVDSLAPQSPFLQARLRELR